MLVALKTHFCILVYNILSSLTYLPYDENEVYRYIHGTS